jgi:hypothetical protein
MRLQKLTNILLVATAAGGCVVTVEPDPYDEPARFARVENHLFYSDGPITNIVTHVDSGDVVLVGDLQPEATVEADIHYDWGRRPELDVYTAGTTLYIDLSCPQTDGECRGEITAWIPHDADLDTTVAAGSLDVWDAEGDWIASAGIAEVYGYRLTSSWVDVFADIGNIDLGFDLAPGFVSAVVSIGDVTLAVPYGVYDVDARVDNGSVRVTGVATDPYASRQINASSGAGNIAVSGF